MNSYTIYTQKLGVKELVIERNQLSAPHFFDANKGKINSSFGFIKKGTAVLNSMGMQIVIPTGSLFYVPDGARYSSVWNGEPDIDYYCIHMVTNKFELFSKENYALQYIPELSNLRTAQIFEEIHSLFSTGSRTNALKALGIYYSFYADAIPYLKSCTVSVQNPSLLLAMEYIEKNADRNFSIDELAAFCSISESRLYHLFQSELKTTPIKYRNMLRVENAASDLLHTDYSIEQIAEQNGFHSTTYFREIFRQYMDVSPAKYRKQAIAIQNPTST